MRLSEKMQVNNSSFLNVFHSLLFEEMADLESLEPSMSFNDSQNSVLTRKRFQEAFENLFPDFNSMNHHPLVNPKYNQNPVNIQPSYVNYGSYPNISNYTKDDGAFVGLGNGAIEESDDPCHLISNEEAKSYENIAFQLELIVQPMFICIGFIFNTIAISVLRR